MRKWKIVVVVAIAATVIVLGAVIVPTIPICHMDCHI